MANASYQGAPCGSKRKPEFLGFFYRCRSEIDGAPIVVIFTGFSRKSANEKTGAMIQTWIIREDVSPVWARYCGADWSICGNCKLREKCYVAIGRAPTQVFKTYHRGRYVPLELHKLDAFHGRSLRIGSYGDPAMVPSFVWEIIIARGELAGWTGYTHQWKRCGVEHLKYFLMASVDTPGEMREAQDLGFKTFRARERDAIVLPGEIVCPASKEAGHKTTCAQCGACNGQRGNRVIFLHGFKVKERMVN